MKAFRPHSTLFIFLFIGLQACTLPSTEPDLTPGRPALGTALTSANVELARIELSARPPGVAAWTVHLEKGLNGAWRMVSRSDRPADPGDLADTKLVNHFLEILGTFATESRAGTGNDAVFGMTPFRLEAKLGEGKSATILRLGELTGANEVYFRVGANPSKTWIGRGALIAFLPMIETPDALVEKSPFFADLDAVQSVRLEKLERPDSGVWDFGHSDGHWLAGKIPLSEEKAAILERIFRQRLVHILAPGESADLAHPDWKLTIHTGRGEESLSVAFLLNDVIAKNPARSERALALYPEMGGALRAFTQARFTPRKSGTK